MAFHHKDYAGAKKFFDKAKDNGKDVDGMLDQVFEKVIEENEELKKTITSTGEDQEDTKDDENQLQKFNPKDNKCIENLNQYFTEIKENKIEE